MFSYYVAKKGTYTLSQIRDIYINHPNDFDWLTAMMGAESDDEIELKKLCNSNFYAPKKQK